MRNRQSPVSWREARIGLGLMGLAVLLSLAAFFLDQIRRSLADGPRVVVTAPEAREIEPGSEVRVAGQPAGRVVAVHFSAPRGSEPGHVIVEAVLRRAAAGFVRADASARVQRTGMLAPMVLEIDPGHGDRPPFDFSDTLRTTQATIIPEKILAKADSLRALMSDVEPQARKLQVALLQGSGTLAALSRDSLLLQDLADHLARLDDFLTRHRDGGSVGKILRDTLIRTAVDSTRAKLEGLARMRASALERRAGVADLEATLEDLSARLDSLGRGLEAGRGTGGRLLYDPELSRQMELLVARRDSLVRELFGNPFRWLRFRIF
ncbi:MAG: MlaD family protein [Gemmatimonadota bacterium]